MVVTYMSAWFLDSELSTCFIQDAAIAGEAIELLVTCLKLRSSLLSK